MTDPDFDALARRQLLAEDEAKFEARVRARAHKLAEEHRQQTAGLAAFPTDPVALRAKHAELVARRDELAAKRAASQRNPALCLSAAEDSELDQLGGRVYDLGKRVRQLDRLEGKAA